MTETQFLNAVKENSGRLYSLALSYTRCTDDAEDILQNVFIKLWNKKEPFNDDAHMQKWLTRVCVNECKSFLSSPFRKRCVSLDQCKEVCRLHSESDYDVLSAVMRLKRQERMVIHLYYYEQYTVSEIASVLKMNESTVKTHMRRARIHLKKMLGEDYYDEL